MVCIDIQTGQNAWGDVGGYSDIFIHTYGFDHFGGFRKMNIFGGMKKLWILLGVFA